MRERERVCVYVRETKLESVCKSKCVRTYDYYCLLLLLLLLLSSFHITIIIIINYYLTLQTRYLKDGGKLNDIYIWASILLII